MSAQTAFCGNCGNPLAPGAPFCGRCGAPVRAAAPLQVPGGQVYQGYPGYAYPRAQPAPGRIGRDHTAQIAVAIGLIALLIVATVIVSTIAILNNTGNGQHQVCTQNCGPKKVTPLPEQATYKSSQFGFEVGYDGSWTVEDKTASSIQLSTDAGGVAVIGMKGSQSGDQVIQGFVNGLPSATYQDIQPVMEVKGAHLGDQDGTGTIFAANFVGSNSSAIKVRFAVITAAKNGVTVIMFAINEADTKDFASGIPEGQKFDYMCTEFTWP